MTDNESEILKTIVYYINELQETNSKKKLNEFIANLLVISVILRCSDEFINELISIKFKINSDKIIE